MDFSCRVLRFESSNLKKTSACCVNACNGIRMYLHMLDVIGYPRFLLVVLISILVLLIRTWGAVPRISGLHNRSCKGYIPTYAGWKPPACTPKEKRPCLMLSQVVWCWSREIPRESPFFVGLAIALAIAWAIVTLTPKDRKRLNFSTRIGRNSSASSRGLLYGCVWEWSIQYTLQMAIFCRANDDYSVDLGVHHFPTHTNPKRRVSKGKTHDILMIFSNISPCYPCANISPKSSKSR